MLSVGQPFPNFALPDQDGRTVKLSDFAGKWLLVYTYPKDDTPGCTLEGKNFSAKKSEFEKRNAAVVGLSEDDSASHKLFCNKFGFTIPLLADTQHTIYKAAGVPQSEWKGVMYWDRWSFLIDPKGALRKVYQKVNPDGHELEVLRDLDQLQNSRA